MCGLGGLDVAVFIGLDVGDVLVAEFRGEDAEHDGSVQVFALVLATHVGADPTAAEIVVVVVDGLGDLGLDIALEGHVVGSAGGFCGVGGDACGENGRTYDSVFHKRYSYWISARNVAFFLLYWTSNLIPVT